jgi:mono/diheme cytochrome c family protein/DNA-binding beta-propeller fold protein YncE
LYRGQVSRTAVAIALSLLAACDSQERDSTSAPDASSGTAVTAAGSAAASATQAKTRATTHPREGGSIARAAEGDALFVADEDHQVLRVLALPARHDSRRADFRTPGRPAQVAVTADRVLVTIRQVGAGQGALLVLRRAGGLDLEEIGRVTLPADAWGVSLTPDQGTALVTSAWTHKVSAVDLGKLEVRWSVDVAREPRGVVVVGGEGRRERAYVSHLVGSGITRIDELGGRQPVVARVDLPAAPLRAPSSGKARASLGWSVVASPGGERAYFPRHALGALAADGWFGVGTVDVMSTADDSAAAPTRAAAPMVSLTQPVAAMFERHETWAAGGVPVIETPGSRLNAPRAAVFRRKTSTLLVVNEGTANVLELDALAMDPTLVVVRGYGTARKVRRGLGVGEQGEAPSGIALSEDEDTAWVYCRATNDVVVLDLPPEEGSYRSAPRAAVVLGDKEDEELAIGRALFHDASNSTVSGGLSCAGCHPEGRDDGHVWHEAAITQRALAVDGTPGPETKFVNFFGGSDLSAIRARWGEVTAAGEGGFGYARQTPMLAGRVKAPGPYGWHGESPDLTARIVAGFGLHRWSRDSDSEAMKRGFAGYLGKFLREGLVPPPRVERPLTAEEERGKALFHGPSQCATCHPADREYGDRTIQALRKLPPPRGFAEDPVRAYKVPSLLFVGESAPYMHDGRFESLESLVELNQDRMGKTAQLTPDDRAALVAFLRTL